MAGGAKIRSISALREFRPALIKFIEEARAALIAAEADASRTVEWLRREQQPYWKKEIRRRQDTVVRCKTDLINKQRTASGDPRSAVEERKALEKAERRLEDARTKSENTAYWLRQLEKEHMSYKGTAQMLASQIIALEDKALHDLDRMAAALEDYVALQVPASAEMGEAPAPAGFAEAAGESFAQRERGRDARPSPFAGYRQATPGPGRRRRGEPAEVDADWPRYELGRVDRMRRAEEIGAIPSAGALDPDQWVSLSPGVPGTERVYLERCDPTDADDSGWYVGVAPADDNPEPERRELDRLRVKDLLELRPDLEAVLKLDRGVLAIVRGAEVESVTMPNDTLAYCRAGEGA